MYFSVISVHCVVSNWQLVDLCCRSVVWIIMLTSLMFCWTMQEQACVCLSVSCGSGRAVCTALRKTICRGLRSQVWPHCHAVTGPFLRRRESALWSEGTGRRRAEGKESGAQLATTAVLSEGAAGWAAEKNPLPVGSPFCN